MIIKIHTVLVLSTLLTYACNPEWEEYYNSSSVAVNENVWNAMQSDESINQFVQILKDYKLDTLFATDIPYTVIVPGNEAFDEFSDTIDETLLKYHICEHFFNPASIQGKRKIQTLTKKYIMLERYNGAYLFDEIPNISESELYRNGKYFIVDKLLEPKPNLYEYYKVNNPLFASYIDSQDSIVLDKELSIPVGYDDFDNTIYDSVIYIINIFEEEYFEVKHEFRDRAATIVFPKEENYNAALNIMADELGGRYTDYNDIPLDWQKNILMPFLINHGVFLYRLEPEAFTPEPGIDVFKLMNALGDSVVIDYTPVEKTLCSNGYAYNYEDFRIPDSLFIGSPKYEGEELVEMFSGKLSWRDGVTVTSSTSFVPKMDYMAAASNDSIIKVLFPSGYSGEFTIEFTNPGLFPRDYVMEVKTHVSIGGIYDIYVNDKLLRTFDYYEFKDRYLESVIPGEWYFADNKNLISFDVLVDNVSEYGPVSIRFEYKGPGRVLSNGFLIDYIKFLPAT